MRPNRRTNVGRRLQRNLRRLHRPVDSAFCGGGLRHVRKQVIVACRSGASGIAVGRAVWKEAVMMNGEERMSFLRTTAHQRISRLTSLCSALAKPFHDFYSADAPFDWYKTY
ncbi:MAG: hypothetical protein U0X87_00845 [Anaerolineales bacterium]